MARIRQQLGALCSLLASFKMSTLLVSSSLIAVQDVSEEHLLLSSSLLAVCFLTQANVLRHTDCGAPCCFGPLAVAVDGVQFSAAVCGVAAAPGSRQHNAAADLLE